MSHVYGYIELDNEEMNNNNVAYMIPYLGKGC